MAEYLEVVAVFTALLYVYFAIKVKSICFLFGLISSAIYIYICFNTKYYFDMLINVYYGVVSIYGIIIWNKDAVEEAPKIKSISTKKRWTYLIIGTLLTLILGWVGWKVLESSLPFADAFTTAFSIIATWMIVKKIIENWLIWIVVDAVAAYMYFIKDLNYTAILYLIYVVLSIVGYLRWKKDIPVRH